MLFFISIFVAVIYLTIMPSMFINYLIISVLSRCFLYDLIKDVSMKSNLK